MSCGFVQETLKTILIECSCATGNQASTTCLFAIALGAAGFHGIETWFWTIPTSFSVVKKAAPASIVALPPSSVTPTDKAAEAEPASARAAQTDVSAIVSLFKTNPRSKWESLSLRGTV